VWEGGGDAEDDTWGIDHAGGRARKRRALLTDSDGGGGVDMWAPVEAGSDGARGGVAVGRDGLDGPDGPDTWEPV